MKTPLLLAAALLLGGCIYIEPPAEPERRPNGGQRMPQKVEPRPADAYRYNIKTASGYCLDRSRSGYQGIIAYPCHNQSNQRFAVSRNSIRVENLCLDVAGGDKRDGAKVIAYACHGNANQQWYREGRTIRSSLNGKCLDAGKHGNQIRLYRCDGSAGQRFSFTQP